MKGGKLSLGDKAATAAKSSPEKKSWRETSLGDKAAAAAKSNPEETSLRETSLGDKAAQKEIMKGSWFVGDKATSSSQEQAAGAKSSPEWRS